MPGRGGALGQGQGRLCAAPAETPQRATGAKIPSATTPRPPRSLAATRLWRAEPQSRRALLPLRLCGLAREKQRRPHHRPLEEPIGTSTPGQVAQSRRAAERSPQARALGTSRPLASARDAQPTPASPRPLETPQTSLRLCASARDKRRCHDQRPLEETIADTPEQVAQSRRAAERSPQARSSGTPRPLASARDAQRRVVAMVGDTPELLAPWRDLTLRHAEARRPHRHQTPNPERHRASPTPSHRRDSSVARMGVARRRQPRA